MTSIPRRLGNPLLATAVALTVLGVGHAAPADGPDVPVVVPVPEVDGRPGLRTPGTDTAIFAGGCFWGLQGVFQHVRGVRSVVAGYDGGDAATATYDQVSTGTTGHAESVEIAYDPSVVSYGQLLQVYFDAATDPTQLDRQYPDTGTQYRGEIFATTPAQAKTAQAYLAQITAARVYSAPLATVVGTDTGFYPAEAHHQNYLLKHPDQPYIAAYDLPKLSVLKSALPTLWTDRPAPLAD